MSKLVLQCGGVREKLWRPRRVLFKDPKIGKNESLAQEGRSDRTAFPTAPLAEAASFPEVCLFSDPPWDLF